VIVAVGHDTCRAVTVDQLKALFEPELAEEEKVLVDVKGLYSIAALKAAGLRFWRL
jgi:UDP-N-acetyl-D-galactosamine dehydrogenase